MSKSTKIIIGVILGLVVICLIVCVVGVAGLGLLGRSVASSIKADPAEAAQVAPEIADITPPDGFQPTASVNILNIKAVIYEAPGTQRSMFLIQLPVSGSISGSQMDTLKKSLEQQSGQELNNLQTINSYDTTVRGQPAQVVVMEGANQDNTPFRQMLLTFQGKGGTAMLGIYGPTDGWDQAAYDAMVKSIQ